MDQDGKQEERKALPPLPESLENAFLVPVDNSSDTLRALADKEPDQVLDIARKQIDCRLRYIEHTHSEEEEREKHRHSEEKGRQSIIFASLAAVTVVFLSSFVYSGVTGKEGLSEKVIDTMLGVLGGGGAVAVAVASKRNNSSNP